MFAGYLYQRGYETFAVFIDRSANITNLHSSRVNDCKYMGKVKPTIPVAVNAPKTTNTVCLISLSIYPK